MQYLENIWARIKAADGILITHNNKGVKDRAREQEGKGGAFAEAGFMKERKEFPQRPNNRIGLAKRSSPM